MGNLVFLGNENHILLFVISITLIFILFLIITNLKQFFNLNYFKSEYEFLVKYYYYIELDNLGKIKKWDDYLSHLFELESLQPIGNNLLEILKEKKVSSNVDKMLNDINRKGVWEGDIKLVHSKFEFVWFQVVAHLKHSSKNTICLYLKDISQIKNNEERSFREKDFYRTMLYTMDEAYILQEKDGSFVQMNQSACSILGIDYDLINTNIYSSKFNEIYNLQGVLLRQEEMPNWKVFNKGLMQKDMTVGLKVDEDIRWINLNAVPISDVQTGDIQYCLTTFRDVTKQIQLRKIALLKSKLRDKLIYDYQGVDNYLEYTLNIIETELASEYISIALVDGKTKEDRKISHWVYSDKTNSQKFKTYHQKDSILDGTKNNIFAKSFRSGKEYIERNTIDSFILPFANEDNEISNMWSIPLYGSGELQGILFLANQKDNLNSNFIDWSYEIFNFISELIDKIKLLEVNQDQQRKFELIAFSSELGLWDWNLISNEIYFDPRWFEIIGYEHSNFESSIDNWFEHIHPNDLSKVKKELDRYLNAEINRFEIKYRMKHKAGDWITVLCKGKITKWDENSKAVKFSGTHFDLSYLEKLESSLEEQRKISMHQSKLAAIGEIAAGVGHEINNPLFISNGYLNVIKAEIFSKDKADSLKIKEAVNKIENANGRIEKIVNGLRRFSRQNSETIEEFSLEALLLDSYNLVKDIFHSDGVEILYLSNLKSEHFITGNPGKMQQVIMNLLTNARDALEGMDRKEITINADYKDNKIKLIISDTGKGIPKELHEKIFEPFFTTKEVDKGTGIGLGLVNSIVQEHGGEIFLESKLNEGAKFIIELPSFEIIKDLSLNEENKQEDTNLNMYDGLQILLVDDEEDIRSLMTDILEDIGAHVHSVSNGIEALDMIKSKKFDLIVSDMKMPKMDGLAFLKKFREDENNDSTKFLVMTGGISSSMEEEKDRMGNGVDGYLYKPLTIQNIKKTIQHLFDE